MLASPTITPSLLPPYRPLSSVVPFLPTPAASPSLINTIIFSLFFLLLVLLSRRKMMLVGHVFNFHFFL